MSWFSIRVTSSPAVRPTRREAVIEAYLGRRHRPPLQLPQAEEGDEASRGVAKAELTVEHLEVRDGDLIGVADVSLRVARGHIVALLGSNGAGKTTTQRDCRTGARLRGRIVWQDEEISGQAADAIVSKGLALSPEGWRLFVGQSVEHLRLGATALRDRTRIDALFERVYAVSAARRTPPAAGTLSAASGKCWRSAALMSEPQLLMLDEPSLGLAPTVVECWYTRSRRCTATDSPAPRRTIDSAGARHRRLRRYGAADRRRRAGGPAAQLQADAQVQEIYLGVSMRDRAGWTTTTLIRATAPAPTALRGDAGTPWASRRTADAQYEARCAKGGGARGAGRREPRTPRASS